MLNCLIGQAQIMEILIENAQVDLPISTRSIKSLVKGFLAIAEVTFDEVSIHFVNSQAIAKLHEKYCDDPTTTDCLSFPMDSASEEGYRCMGDVFVCPATAIDYVKKHGEDAYKETTLYLIHGLLHLLGYDDIEEEDRQEMRAAETRYLNHIEKKKLWLKP